MLDVNPKVSLIDSQDAEQIDDPLDAYISQQVISRNPIKPISYWPRARIVVRIFLCFIGALWGLPWIAISSKSAIFFPAQIQGIMSYLLAIGIVIAVGSDGLWLMLGLGDRLVQRPDFTKLLMRGKEEGWVLLSIRTGVPIILSFLACISAVYAAYKYNEGWEKCFACIILLVNYTYGLYGYSTLVNRIITAARCFYNADYRRLVKLRALVAERIDMLCRERKLCLQSFIKSSNFIKFLINLEKKKNSFRINILRSLFCWTGCLAISITSTLVTFFLAREFFLKDIVSNIHTANIFAVFAELPSFVITAVSTFDVFKRLFDATMFKWSDKLTRKANPGLNKVFAMVAALLALGAPSAGTYIAYITIKTKVLDEFMVTAGWITVMLARYVFSNFTLNILASRVIGFINQKFYPNSTRVYLRLENCKYVIKNTDPIWFKSSLFNRFDGQ